MEILMPLLSPELDVCYSPVVAGEKNEKIRSID
jgi:hypothetical protein